MSTYLAKLKQLESGIFSRNPPNVLPTKPPKDAFAGFDGAGVGHVEENIIDKAVLAESVKHGGVAWMWQVTLSDRLLIVSTTPASTKLEMLEIYPDAINIEVIE